MSSYFDTSFLMPLVRREPTTGEVEKFLRQQPQAELSTSHWARVEFCSGIARDVRMKVMTREDAALAIADFESKMSPGFSLLPIASPDCELAHEFLQRYETGLRAGDALHLAIARNNNAQAIYSLDDKMLRAGKLLGLPVRRGIRGR
ncbi:MAG: type II toxin-antitoxin system VapC family toxin [Alphaproteobacteria bacterium]|nr:type II toxin-antitoxin system VapC family toxin [Alphaproteobacteria bacterium]